MKERGAVLVIKLGDLTEFVLSLPAMRRIREAHPKAAITLLTTQPFAALARACPYFDAVETAPGEGGLGDLGTLARQIKRAGYARIYDLDNTRRSNLIFQLMRPFPPAWSGSAAGCSLPHRNPQRMSMHLIERQADQLKAAGIWPDAPTSPGAGPPPDLSWMLRQEAATRPVWGGVEPRPYAILAPGGAEGRRWPDAAFGEAAVELGAAGFDIVIVGGPEMSASARTIQRSAPRARDLTGRSDFAQLAVLGSKAAVAIGAASGPLQLIAAGGAPTIVLLALAEDPAIMGPRGHVTVLQAPDLSAVPSAEVMRTVRAVVPFA